MEYREIDENIERRNFPLFIADGTLFFAALLFISYSTVLPAFVNTLTNSSVLIGLVTAVRFGGWFLPQMAAANYLERKPYKRPIMLLTSFLSRISVFLIAFVTYQWGAEYGGVTLALFFLFYFLFNFCEGITTIAWVDISAKTIRATRRGSLMSTMQLFGSILGLGAGFLIRQILAHPGFSFPVNYSMIFLLASIILAVDYVFMVLLKEPAGKVKKEQRSFFQYLTSMPAFMKKNVVFMKMIMLRVLMSFGFLVLPFYVVYSQEIITTGAGIVGIYVLLQTSGMIFASLLFGRLSDRYGNRVVLLVTAICTFLMPVLALLVYVLSLGGQSPLLTLLYAPIFVGIGLSECGQIIGYMNYLLEIVSEEERPTYYGLSNTISALGAFFPVLGGLLAARFGYEFLFFVAALFLLAGVVCAFRLPEPRHLRSQL